MTLDLQPVSAGALIEQVIASMSVIAEAKNVRLRQEVQPELADVPMDAHRIMQVLTNLVSNAIKHTPLGGNIVIAAREAAGRRELVEISVRDNGCGIAKEEQERIFDRLYQVKAGDAATEQGIGLGLYLCRELVQLHGGNIRGTNPPNPLQPTGGAQQSIDLSANASGFVAKCSDTATFNSAVPDLNFARAQVQKITAPALAATPKVYEVSFVRPETTIDVVAPSAVSLEATRTPPW